ncbi:MAG: hypothetical protein HPM95_07000 [Alphaproteobacteria bacterium]|nr:hypothetical protein [Alphaproteobacteria bacterium]
MPLLPTSGSPTIACFCSAILRSTTSSSPFPVGGQTSPDWAHYGTWKMWTLLGGVHMTREMLVSHGLDVTMAGPEHTQIDAPEGGEDAASGSKTHVESLANVRYVDADGQFLKHRPDAPLELRVSSFGGYRTSTRPALPSHISETCPDGSWPLVVLNDASGDCASVRTYGARRFSTGRSRTGPFSTKCTCRLARAGCGTGSRP